MILNIDFNPKIEEYIKIDSLNQGNENYINELTTSAGGLGAQLEVLMDLFKERVYTTGFIGGENEIYYNRLINKNNYNYINIKDKISKEIIIDSSGKETKLIDLDPRITKEEITDFYNLYHSMLRDFEYVVGFDYLPKSLPENIYKDLVKIARLKGRKYILEITKKSSLMVLEEVPYLVIIGREMLEEYTNLRLDSNKSLVGASNYILNLGVKGVFINMYYDGIIYSTKGRSFLIRGEKENYKTKSNLGLVAGILIGIIRYYKDEMFLRLIYAYNNLCNTMDIRDIDLVDVKKKMSNVSIERII